MAADGRTLVLQRRYLDPAQHRYLEEAGSANIVVLMKDGTVVTPKSGDSAGVTRRSVMTIAETNWGMPPKSGRLISAEVDQIEEFAACGTAACDLTGWKDSDERYWYAFHGNGEAIGPVTQALYDRLTSIQKLVG